MWMLLAAGLACAAEPPEVTGDVGFHVQGFAAPDLGGVQSGRSWVVPTLEAEGELRWSRLALRGHAGLWPRPWTLDAGLLGLVVQDLPGGGRWSYGLEVGAARTFARTRSYAGPTLGIRRDWNMGALAGVVGARITAGLSIDHGTLNDWTLLTPGPALGGHLGVALTFSPDDGLE